MTGDTHHDPVESLVRSAQIEREPASAEISAVADLLHTWLARRGLDPGEREEVIQDAIHRLLAYARKGTLDPARPPGAWLRVVADHLAIDKLRKRPNEPAIEFDEHRHGASSEDDGISAMLDRAAAEAEVLAATRKAAQAGRYDIVRVVATWRGLAQANGQAPSTREVADRLGISHMTVQRALNAFKDLIEP
jgi:DNA-directed RNA polymerase specialized sigma24 family protein